MPLDITSEILFKTARSGGKGGQNVNKVETMVEGRWNVLGSNLTTDVQKQQIHSKLTNRITAEGYLLVKSQSERTQQGNRSLVIQRMNELVNKALIPKKLRIATRPSAASKSRNAENKKLHSFLKQNRKKWRPGDI